jgi:hypothetical protein
VNASRRAALRITTRPLWAHRLRVEGGRYLLYAAAFAGLAASARNALAPLRAPGPAAAVSGPTPDIGPGASRSSSLVAT